MQDDVPLTAEHRDGDPTRPLPHHGRAERRHADSAGGSYDHGGQRVGVDEPMGRDGVQLEYLVSEGGAALGTRRHHGGESMLYAKRRMSLLGSSPGEQGVRN